ncbi:phage terminase large subunit, partial [Shinella sp.]|uniref:phage terminase large subunit n=1 Tax=Shinella sp. TaxID=1870904 RepID=UPI003F71FB62
YGRSLTDELSSRFRRIINADWYRELFPSMAVDPRKDTVSEVRTTSGGYRLTTTIGGALTGRGGMLVIVDDPLKAADADSEAARSTVNTWFRETLLTRLDDKQTGAIVVVMQRLHDDDLAGQIIRVGGWTHLNLPAIAAQDQVLQVGQGRTRLFRSGELLHANRDSQSVLEELRQNLGGAAFSAQYLQRPVPVGGNMVDVSWFGRYDVPPQKIDYRCKIVQSWDTASKADELNDYSVGITALVQRDAFYILKVVRARLLYPDLKRRIIDEKRRWGPDYLLIEDKGSGTSLLQDLRRDGVIAKAIEPKGDKIVRMSACTAIIESGSVFLPRQAPWLDEFEHELLAFPKGVHDDQVDALSQFLNWWRTRSRYTLDNIS